MGHRMEVYVPQNRVDTVISIVSSFGIDAKQIGRTEPADSNHLTLTDPVGHTFSY